MPSSQIIELLNLPFNIAILNKARLKSAYGQGSPWSASASEKSRGIIKEFLEILDKCQNEQEYSFKMDKLKRTGVALSNFSGQERGFSGNLWKATQTARFQGWAAGYLHQANYKLAALAFYLQNIKANNVFYLKISPVDANMPQIHFNSLNPVYQREFRREELGNLSDCQEVYFKIPDVTLSPGTFYLCSIQGDALLGAGYGAEGLPEDDYLARGYYAMAHKPVWHTIGSGRSLAFRPILTPVAAVKNFMDYNSRKTTEVGPWFINISGKMDSSGDTSPHTFIPETHSETTPSQKHFLCSLLNIFRPKKILEVGVSAGGSSALILRNTGPGQSLFGVDKAMNYYRNPDKPVGYEVDLFCNREERARYTIFRGLDIIECLEMIGADIDFVFLDSAHTLPGELLQFLAIYKFLSPGAVVAFHDLNANRPAPPKALDISLFHDQNATNAAFSVIGSKCKMVENTNPPHMGALICDEETERNIPSTFMALSLTWRYYPDELIEKYRVFFRKYYNNFCNAIYDYAAVNQKKINDQKPKKRK